MADGTQGLCPTHGAQDITGYTDGGWKAVLACGDTLDIKDALIWQARPPDEASDAPTEGQSDAPVADAGPAANDAAGAAPADSAPTPDAGAPGDTGTEAPVAEPSPASPPADAAPDAPASGVAATLGAIEAEVEHVAEELGVRQPPAAPEGGA